LWRLDEGHGVPKTSTVPGCDGETRMMQCFPTTLPDERVMLALAVCAGLVLMTWVIARQAPFSGKGFCIVSHGAMLWWMGAAALELWATTQDCKMAFAMVAWPAIALLPTVWAFFLHAYAFGRAPRIARGEWAILAGGPLAVTALALSNPWHGLFYGPQTALREIAGAWAVVYDHGPLFHAAAAYLYVFMAASIAIALRGLWYASPAYRGHFLVLVAITGFPVAGNLAYILGGVTLFGFDPTPFMFAGVLCLFAWMISMIRPFDVSTIGRDVLFFSARDPVVMVDTAGRAMAWNPAAQQGLAPPDAPFRRGAAVADGSAIAGLVRALAGGGGTLPRQMDIAGRRFGVRVLPVNRPLSRRRPVMGWLIWLTDVSDTMALQDALANERDYYATLLETDLSGILAFDKVGRIIFANAEAEHLLGLASESALGGRHDDARWQICSVDGAPLEPDELPISQVLNTRRRLRDARVSIRRADGARRALSLNATYVEVPGMPVRALCSIVDITDRLAAEVSLREAVAVAEAANAAKSRFLANMSHEIRTPLNAVLGMAEVLEGSLTAPAQREIVATIRDSGALLLHLLNDLLDFAKIDTGKLMLESVRLVPAEVARRALSLHAARAAEKGLDLTLECGPGADDARLGDSFRITQILHNLLANALKFTEAGRVTLRVRSDGPDIVFEAEDTGIGMTAEQQAHLFADFEQADSSISRRFGGTGLGMAIVHHLVEQMKGRIDVASRPARGTRVTVRVPLPRATAPEPPADAGRVEQASRAAAPLTGVRVLAADDIATNRLVLKALLSRLGAEAVIVEDGAQAVAAYRPGMFDVLLLDISMPVLDGIATLAELHRIEAAAGRRVPPALATTANVLREQVEEYLAAGFVGHVSKPMNSDSLRDEILRVAKAGAAA
jgi:PAS domain S-box-containing protein